MSDRKYYLLVKRVYELSRDGRLTWEESNGARRFATKVGLYKLVIREIDDPEYPDQPDYALEVFNEAGRWVDTVFNHSLRAFVEDKVDGLGPYHMLQTTYRLAHRQALKVDETIGLVLEKLDSLSAP